MKSSRLYRLGRYCAEHVWTVFLVWALVIGGSFTLFTFYGGQTSDTISVPGSEAEEARERLGEHYPELSGATAQVVFHVDEGTLAEAERMAAVATALQQVADLDNVTGVTDPSQSPLAVSGDTATAYADVFYDVPVGDIGAEGFQELSDALEPARDAGVEAYAGGELGFATSGAETGKAEMVGLGVALVLLVVIFGSLLAAGLPILTALCSVGVVTALLHVAAVHYEIPAEAPDVGMMLGLGIGIDYALLVVSRYREELTRGHDVLDAVGNAVTTSGRNVMFAGLTVIIAVAGLYLSGIPAITALATVCASVVCVSVLASITLVPAVLGLGGHRFMPRRWKAAAADTTAPEAGQDTASRWRRWALHVADRPWRYLALGTLILAALSVPAASMELSMPDSGSTAEGTDARSAYDLITDELGPGHNGPLTVMISGPDPEQNTALLQDVTRILEADAYTEAVTDALPSADGEAVVLQAIPTVSPADPAVTDMIERIRGEFAGLDSGEADILVTGPTAVYSDLTEVLEDAIPVVVLAVVGFSMLLLLVVFRSIGIAVTAAVFNLLGIGASFGALVIVFQWGWGLSLFGLDETQAIASFVPIVLFAIVFGLSMDYEVFLMGRVREEYVRTGDNRQALANGMSQTARVITSAALIMVSVFLGFAFAQEPLLKMLGLGLAVAVAVDATVVRMLIIPAAFAALGKANWWMPRWLDRLIPHFDPHGPAEKAEPPTAAVQKAEQATG